VKRGTNGSGQEKRERRRTGGLLGAEMNGELLVGRVSLIFFMIYPTSFCLFMEADGSECKGSKKLY
jgi:hypothetical protein